MREPIEQARKGLVGTKRAAVAAPQVPRNANVPTEKPGRAARADAGLDDEGTFEL
jgi:hypothetical protein